MRNDEAFGRRPFIEQRFAPECFPDEMYPETRCEELLFVRMRKTIEMVPKEYSALPGPNLKGRGE